MTICKQYSNPTYIPRPHVKMSVAGWSLIAEIHYCGGNWCSVDMMMSVYFMGLPFAGHWMRIFDHLWLSNRELLAQLRHFLYFSVHYMILSYFVVVIWSTFGRFMWCIYLNPPGLRHWYCDNHTITTRANDQAPRDKGKSENQSLPSSAKHKKSVTHVHSHWDAFHTALYELKCCVGVLFKKFNFSTVTNHTIAYKLWGGGGGGVTFKFVQYLIHLQKCPGNA